MNPVKILKSIIPLEQQLAFKKFIYRFAPFNFNYWIDKNLNNLKRKINLYFLFCPSKKKEFAKELKFLNNTAKADYISSFVFPYSFVFNYDFNDIKVFKDVEKGLFYVDHKGKKLYYSKDYQSEIDIKKSYYYLTIEQDINSPHRYLSENFDVEKNDVVIDIGAAEGNFSLDVVERAGAIYIFEYDKNWIEALNATFEPWKDKVHIINKYVSNVDNENCATLNCLMGDKPVNFIKLDVEGAEVQILESSKKILENNSSLKLAICTYHQKNDAKTIERILNENKYNYNFSNGFMLFIYKKLTPPYFRRGLIRAQK